MRLPDIAMLVPHAAPMLLLDRVLRVDAETLCAEVAIRPDSLFYGERGIGAWVGIEYMAQAIAAYAGYHAQQRGEPVKIGFLLGARGTNAAAPGLSPVIACKWKRNKYYKRRTAWDRSPASSGKAVHNNNWRRRRYRSFSRMTPKRFWKAKHDK